MTRPHYFTIALILAIGAGAAIAHIVPLTFASQLLRNLFGSLHGPGFGAIAIVVMITLRASNTPLHAYLIAAAFSIALGTITEFLQFVGPRDADLRDLIHNIIGVIGFLGVTGLFDHGLKKQAPWVSSVLSFLLVIPNFVIAVLPSAWYAYAILAQSTSLPSLLSFEELWERSIYRAPRRMQFAVVNAPDGWPATGNSVAILQVSDGRMSGLEISPYSDWRQYSRISFLAASGVNASTSIRIIVRDMKPDGGRRAEFEQVLKIDRSPQRYSIDLAVLERNSGRSSIDLSSISTLAILLTEPTDGDFVLIDDFRLE